jgi:ABC-type multidrug transport system ATPase subunit
MGASGAGKTTLLNVGPPPHLSVRELDLIVLVPQVLAQRVTTGIVTGDMLVNGAPLPVSFQRQTGYCQQQDTHMSTSTVREALIFSAVLRQPAAVPLAEKLAYGTVSSSPSPRVVLTD